jgi:moderate conductance mechanosensitive channel
VPDLTAQGQSLSAWLENHAVALVFWGVVLLVTWRYARPIVHRILLRFVQPPTIAAEGPVDASFEVEKRVSTLEDLFAKLIRFGVIVAFVVLFLSLFDAWSIIAGLGLVAAALTLAGQSIVLDYLTGILLFLEGPYFKGDVVILSGVEGTVEEVGLRRTIVRDVRGTVHSISNGEIRIASNETRMYGMSVVEVGGIAVADVERVIAVMNEVGALLAAEEPWSSRVLETPTYSSTVAFAPSGVTLRMSGRVRPADRVRVDAELRRRLAMALAAADIQPNQQLMPAAATRAGGP